MPTKILLIVLSIAVFSSCSTAYKSGQTPDDVYYSPVRIETNDDQQNDNRDQVKQDNREDNTIRMRIRDRRWKEFDDDRNYINSPYNYCTCNCNNYGYYYNPYYHPWPIYLTKVTPAPSRFTPRTVNLNAYTGYNSNAPVIPKTGNSNTGINWIKPTGQYNNSNSGSNNRSSSSNNNRTYSPSSSNKSSSSSSSNSSSSSSSSSKSETITRPKRE